MLREVDIAIGMGLGLFAIFTILRFRTRNFSVKDMAYIFTTIGVSVINTFNMLMFPFIGVFIINVIILGAVFILEEFLRKNSFNKHSIIYDDLDLLKPGNKSKLLKDISSKLGQEVLRIKVRRVDFKRETAEVDVFFRD